MGILKRLDEKVVVTRGYLMLWPAIAIISAGGSLMDRGGIMQGFGVASVVLGLVALLIGFRYLFKPPMPFDPPLKQKAAE